ncbi:hypothetical protein [Hymenobacter guriensis]|uniref:Uncharacterized protein n=1 Tax=Hymenobacter guriensis TaxID=2793065 RepID=A0ABS0KWY3_9BACT|nr:hypothetical protein [Hymenobacter guriensis]MBG8552367.1 hypothetical protein [Hymenobacter guriensis]
MNMTIMEGKYLKSIPMEVLRPFEKQAYRNHDQTLERLNQRGGLTPKETLAIIRGCSFYRLNVTEDQAEAELSKFIKAAQSNVPSTPEA